MAGFFMKNDQIKITSKIHKGLSAKITLSGEVYLIDTEDIGIKNPFIMKQMDFHSSEF